METRMVSEKYSTRALQKSKKTSKKGIAILLSALISRIELFGEIMPFGAALYAAEYISTPPVLAGVVACFSALFPSFMPTAALKYALCMLIFSFLAGKKGSYILKTPLRRGIYMGICVFASGLLLLFGGQILIYDFFALLLEGGITCAATFLFAQAKTALLNKTARETPADTLSVSALCGIVILGIGGIFNLYGLHLTIPLSVLATLLLSHESGITTGSIAGITLGLLATLESGNPVLGAFAVSGMAAGYFSKFGKPGAAVSFIAANSMITFYTGGKTEMVLNLYEILAPVLIYLAIPNAVTTRMSIRHQISRGQTARLRDLLTDELHEKANAFSFLSDTLTEISDKNASGVAVSAFFERAARHACSGCSRLSHCWKDAYHRTYCSLFVMLEICMKNGVVTKNDMPISLEHTCIKKDAFVRAVNTMYEVYKVDKLWESRVKESRLMVARQLAGMSKILQNMEKNVRSSVTFRAITEERLRKAFYNKNIPIYDLSATMDRHGQTAIKLRTESDILASQIAEIASSSLHESMEIVRASDGFIHLMPLHRFSLRVESRSVKKDGSDKSGDSFDSIFMENGYYLLAVSDGMGSGERAGIDSRATIDMLKTLIYAGFDAETAIGLVNSVLMLKTADETFATIDMVLVNAKNGEAEFMKVGAADSFVKHGKELRFISAGTLPAGILTSPDVAHFTTHLMPGDMLCMVTDGILDAGKKTGNTNWVRDILQSYEGNDAAVLADTILETAKAHSGGHVQDDMTIIVAYFDFCQNSEAEIA